MYNREVYKKITMCVNKPNPTHQNGKIFDPTQSNPWMDPTHVHVCGAWYVVPHTQGVLDANRMSVTRGHVVVTDYA